MPNCLLVPAVLHQSGAAAREMKPTALCMPCRSIVQGKPSPLLSSFKLSYYTLLNLLRRAEGSGHTMEYVIQRSFQQFQFERTLPALQVYARQSGLVQGVDRITCFAVNLT